MIKQQKKDASKRILDAAISLFAQKSYHAVGVREIANTANVNISMISYYFNGKMGILKAIINEFHDKYYEIIMKTDIKNLAIEECIRLIVRNIVTFVKENTALAMIVFNSIPLDIPDIKELKTEKVTRLIRGVSGLFTKFGLDPENPMHMTTVGPALLSMVLIHFRFRYVQQKVFDLEFSDEYYEEYIETISTLYLNGISGIAAKNKNMKGKIDENNS